MKCRIILGAMLCVGLFTLSGCPDIEGAQGPQGPPGADGAKGEKGDTGPQGPPGSADPEQTNGSRLRRVFRTTADGGRAFDGWYDTEIGGPCAFLNDVNTDERCFPVDPHGVPITLGFIDAACSKPIAVIGKGTCGVLPPAFSYRLPNECGYRARSLGAAIEAPVSYYRLMPMSDGDMQCVLVVNPPPSLFYAVHPEIDPDDLVGGTVKID